jgi:hypothetical protein
MTATRGYQAFLYENGEMLDLNDRITDNRWGLLEATTISDSGIIGINGTFQGVHNKAVLLTPVVN